MPFPEFDPNKKKILFFSRGRGRGHAIPDIEIVKELQKLRDDVDVRFVSYASGARTFEEANCPLIDLGLPEESTIADITVLAGRLIGWLDPDVVVCHEEFAALPTAKIFEKPTAFVIDWFSDPDEYAMDTLRFADQVLFIGEAGVFDEPLCVKERVTYAGHVIRRFDYSKADRVRARDELGIPSDAFLVSVIPGRFATEKRAPVLDLVLAAFAQLEQPHKALAWVAGEDCEDLRERTKDLPSAFIYDSVSPIERLIVATDVAITKANRGATIDLAALETPVIALSQGLNPIDDRILTALDAASFHFVRDLDRRGLCEAIAAQARVRRTTLPALHSDGAENCAAWLSRMMPPASKSRAASALRSGRT